MRAAFSLISPESPAILLKRLEDSIRVKRKYHRDQLKDNASRLIDKRSRWLSESLNDSQSRPYYCGFVTNDGFEVIRIPTWCDQASQVFAKGHIDLNRNGESIIHVTCRYPLLTKVVMGSILLAFFAFGLITSMTTSDVFVPAISIGWSVFMLLVFLVMRIAEEKDLEWNLRKVLHAKSLS